MNILDFIKSFFTKEEIQNFGIVQSDVDNLAPSDKVVGQSEVVAKVNTPTFKGVNGDNSIRRFPYQYQSSSSSCVAHTMAKIATVLYYLEENSVIKYSPAWFYTQRSNKPEEGMIFNDIAFISSIKGCLMYDLMPCDGYSEALMNAFKVEQYQLDSADAFKIPENWVILPFDFDTVASTIEVTKKPIMAWFQFGLGEFFSTTYPQIKGNDKRWSHSITLTDTTTMNGKQYLVAEDSADKEEYRIKYISREFFARCFLARYPIQFRWAIPTTDKPHYTGTIQSLQDILKYEGLMPSNIPSTGVLGPITKKALIGFQLAHDISPALGNFGNITEHYLLTHYQ